MDLAYFTDSLIKEINGVEVTTISSVYKLVLSLLLGSIIGYERKKKGQPAGVRTFSLIAMGSTLAMILSIYVPQEYLGLKNGDPGRIAAQVVTGIGFLGAGAIMQMKGSVRGLTTAAGIWIIAAIGLSVGVGMYLIAVFATGLSLVILMYVDKIEHRANLGSESRTIKLKVSEIMTDISVYRETLAKGKISVVKYNIEYDFEKNITDIYLFVLLPENVDIFAIGNSLRDIAPTMSLTINS